MLTLQSQLREQDCAAGTRLQGRDDYDGREPHSDERAKRLGECLEGSHGEGRQVHYEQHRNITLLDAPSGREAERQTE